MDSPTIGYALLAFMAVCVVVMGVLLAVKGYLMVTA